MKALRLVPLYESDVYLLLAALEYYTLVPPSDSLYPKALLANLKNQTKLFINPELLK